MEYSYLKISSSSRNLLNSQLSQLIFQILHQLILGIQTKTLLSGRRKAAQNQLEHLKNRWQQQQPSQIKPF
jgi:hypothetical protein